MLISYFSGLITMILISLFLIVSIPQIDAGQRPGAGIEIYSSFYAFRFLFMIIFTVLSAAVAIKILRSYKVNYPFIFDLDPDYKVTFMQLLRVWTSENDLYR